MPYPKPRLSVVGITKYPVIYMDKDNIKSFNMNENILKKYLEPEFSNDNEFIAKLSAYFENFYNFCFVLEDNIVLKGQINFKYK